MRSLILKYFREIIIIVLILLCVFLILKPNKNEGDLLNYKIEEIDKTINKLKEKQGILNDKLEFYENEILKVDSKIKNIRENKTTINNYYEKKKNDIPKYSKNQLDSLFKARYNY